MKTSGELFLQWLAAAALVAAFVPMLLWCYAIVHFPAGLLPYQDQWDHPFRVLVAWREGTFRFWTLGEQFNDSRSVLPNLLSLGLFLLKGNWSIKAEQLVGIGLSTALAVLYASLAVRVLRGGRASFAAFFSLAIALLLGQSSFVFHTYSITMERTLVDIGVLTMALLLLSARRPAVQLLLINVIAAVAVYTHSSGITCPILAALSALYLWRRGRVSWRVAATFVLMSVAAAASVCLGWRVAGLPASHQEPFRFASAQVATFVLAFMGNNNPFGSTDAEGHVALAIGTVTVLAYAAGVFGFWRTAQHSTGTAERAAGSVPDRWDALAAVLLVSLHEWMLAVLTCLMRLPVDWFHAIRMDYTIHPVPVMMTAVMLLAASIAASGWSRARKETLAAVMLVLAVVSSAWISRTLWQAGSTENVGLHPRLRFLEECLLKYESLPVRTCFPDMDDTPEMAALQRVNFALANRLSIFHEILP